MYDILTLVLLILLEYEGLNIICYAMYLHTQNIICYAMYLHTQNIICYVMYLHTQNIICYAMYLHTHKTGVDYSIHRWYYTSTSCR